MNLGCLSVLLACFSIFIDRTLWTQAELILNETANILCINIDQIAMRIFFHIIIYMHILPTDWLSNC